LKKVEIASDLNVDSAQGISAFAAEVEILLSDGRRIVVPDQPMPTDSDDQSIREIVEEKFAECSKGRISKAQSIAALEMLRSLERSQDLHQLTRLFAVASENLLDIDPEL
jgi:hypothetical protein